MESIITFCTTCILCLSLGFILLDKLTDIVYSDEDNGDDVENKRQLYPKPAPEEWSVRMSE